MASDAAAVERARAEARRGDWPEVYRLLRHQDPESLNGTDLERLADAAWWLCRVEESLDHRRRAHAAQVADGDLRRAGYSAWMLAVEYGYIGRTALAAGWLTKARRHLADLPLCEEQGFLAFSDAELAAEAGDLDQSLRLARHVVDVGSRCDSPDVVAMGRMLEGRLLVATGDVLAGLNRLDEILRDVVEGELSDLVAGWLYCLAVPICLQVSDLHRAAEWNDAAMAWCATLPAGTPFHGLCRVHHVELLGLGGAWDTAQAEADRACRELMAYHPNMAGESFHVAGELHRRRGDLSRAEDAFLRAHELGHDPHPGLALVRLAQGRDGAAATALASCLASDTWGPRRRARLLAAQVEVALARSDGETAHAAAAELEQIAADGPALLSALAATARGSVALADGDTTGALRYLKQARTLWLDLDLPYETAQARLRLADACRASGDEETAELEHRAARATLDRLGATLGREQIDARRSREPTGGSDLTPRQLEVLRLVAAGRTNRQIAEDLVISIHTVSRHLDNIYTRLGVSSRAAATSVAHIHGLV